MAADILWLDALTANVDRTWRNPNLLVWHGEPVVHRPRRRPVLPPPVAAAGPRTPGGSPRSPSTPQHARPRGRRRRTSRAAHEKLTSLVSADLLDEVTDQVPDEWLEPAPGPGLPRRRPRGIPRAPARPGGLHGLASREARHEPAGGYQYVVLRCVPRVEREEFVNVGVVVYSQSADFLEGPLRRRRGTAARARARPRPRGRRGLAAHARRRMQWPVRARAAGGPPAGRRFGWLSAPRSTVVQPGPVHGGLTADPAATLAALVHRLVG